MDHAQILTFTGTVDTAMKSLSSLMSKNLSFFDDLRSNEAQITEFGNLHTPYWL
jgi:hypothetical protein